MIIYSNTYLIDLIDIHTQDYNNIYKIYHRLTKNYFRTIILKNYDKNNIINIKGTVINLISPFYISNSGHYLTYILNIIDIINKTNTQLFDNQFTFHFRNDPSNTL